jgi:hypothetical protein
MPLENPALAEKSFLQQFQEDVGLFLRDALPDSLRESLVTDLQSDPIKELEKRVQKTGIAIIIEITDIEPDDGEGQKIKLTLMFHVEENSITNHGISGTNIGSFDAACMVWAAMLTAELDPFDTPSFDGLQMGVKGSNISAWDLRMTVRCQADVINPSTLQTP